ncbi:MAG: phage integrase SAM-like domain-containing protein [Chitinophagales bacterium]|nr:phage integrase SAM-like domain-containing protein [Chitinophagales bacterium]
MSTPKIILFKGKTLSNGNHPIMLRIYKKKEFRISLGLSTKVKNWDSQVGKYKKSEQNFQEKNRLINSYQSKAEKIIHELELSNKPFSIAEFKAKLLDTYSSNNVIQFLDVKIKELKIKDRIGNMRQYSHLKSKLLKQSKTGDLTFNQIDYNWLQSFETFLFSIGLKNAGISTHMRTLRALFNEAIRRGIVETKYYPFSNQFNRNAYSLSHLKSDPSPKPLDLNEVSLLKAFNSIDHPNLSQSYDVFMFMLRARGINFIDLCFLTIDNISGDRVNYIRNKTDKHFSIKISPEMDEIINKYKGEYYIFPYLGQSTKADKYYDLYYKTRYALIHFNKDLKQIAKICGIKKKVTSYTARYTYTNILVQNNVNVTLIQQALGHSSLATTQHYIKKYSNDEIDRLDLLL